MPPSGDGISKALMKYLLCPGRDPATADIDDIRHGGNESTRFAERNVIVWADSRTWRLLPYYCKSVAVRPHLQPTSRLSVGKNTKIWGQERMGRQ
jgi:hypothetical protein